jgi:hypothetical protein
MKSSPTNKNNVVYLDIIEKTLDKVMDRTGIYVDGDERQLIVNIIKKELKKELSKAEEKAEAKILDFLKIVRK